MRMNSKHIYLQKKESTFVVINEDGKPETRCKVLEIDHSSAQRIGESVGVDQTFDVDKWILVTYDLIRNHARIYTAITLVNTNFFVAFNKVVAIYDVVRKTWRYHFFFEHIVCGLLRN